MNLDIWLSEATQGLPIAVQERLAQEYHAHWQESRDVGGATDALILFGPPKKVRRALKQMYSSQDELQDFQNTAPRFVRIQSWLVPFVLFPCLIFACFLDLNRSRSVLILAITSLLMIATPLFYREIRRFGQQQRIALKYLWLVSLMMLNIVCFQWLTYESSTQTLTLLTPLLTLSSLFVIWREFRKYARLRRTLALKQP